MRRGLIVIVLIALLVGVGAASAQETLSCETETMETMADAMEGIAAQIREGESPIIEMLLLRLVLSYAIAECNGLTFSSEVDGLQPTLGPFILEPGTYIATATTEGSIIAEFTVLDGECGEGNRMRESLFILGRDEANDGAEVVVQSEGCEVLLSISSAREPWTLSFEKIR